MGWQGWIAHVYLYGQALIRAGIGTEGGRVAAEPGLEVGSGGLSRSSPLSDLVTWPGLCFSPGPERLPWTEVMVRGGSRDVSEAGRCTQL